MRPSAPVSVEAQPGVKPAPAETAFDDLGAEPVLDEPPRHRRQQLPVQASGGPAVRDRLEQRGVPRAARSASWRSLCLSDPATTWVVQGTVSVSTSTVRRSRAEVLRPRRARGPRRADRDGRGRSAVPAGGCCSRCWCCWPASGSTTWCRRSTRSCATTRCSGTCGSCSRASVRSCSSTSSSATTTAAPTTATPARRSTPGPRARTRSSRSAPSGTSTSSATSTSCTPPGRSTRCRSRRGCGSAGRTARSPTTWRC